MHDMCTHVVQLVTQPIIPTYPTNYPMTYVQVLIAQTNYTNIPMTSV